MSIKQAVDRWARRNRRDSDGFTLIELLVVVIIIGILAAIAIPVYLNQRGAAYNASTQADVKDLGDTLIEYAADNPTVAAAPAVSDLTGEGFRWSPGNYFTVYGAAALNEWCVEAYAANGKLTSGHSTFYWYDSLAGGIISGHNASPSDLSDTTTACGALMQSGLPAPSLRLSFGG